MRLLRRPLESFPEPNARRHKTVATIPETPRADDPPMTATPAPTRRAARRPAAPPLPPADRGRLLLPPKECHATRRPNPEDSGKPDRAAVQTVPTQSQDRRGTPRKHGTNPA